MLNPSTADDLRNDPTVERCQRRAYAMGHGGLEVVNLFAYRSTYPSELYVAEDPVGPLNDKAILAACRCSSMTIAAWGEHGAFRERAEHVRAMLQREGVGLFALALNASGQPKHPLYVSASTLPKRFA
jgi:hypothetical protein